MDGEELSKATRIAVVHIMLWCVTHLGALFGSCCISLAKPRVKPGITAALFALLRCLDSSGHVSDNFFFFPWIIYEQDVSIYSETVFIYRPTSAQMIKYNFIFETYTLSVEVVL